MARAGESNNAGTDKPQPQDMMDNASNAYEPNRQEIHGNGAGDGAGISERSKIKGEDKEVAGVKPPDAMGAGS